MPDRLPAACLDQIFLAARTQNKWQARDVPEALLREIVEIMALGPTSANCQPARIVFVRSGEAKARLAPHLSSANREKTMAAPVCAIIGHDLDFHDNLPRTFPHQPSAKSWFTGNETLIRDTAFRNGSLQGAYLMIAARAVGLDVGPMSGFDNAGVDREFFAGSNVKSNFLCNLGYGDPAGVMQRLPRLGFDEYARIA